MFCPKCGKEVPSQVKFCPKCGASISSKASGSTPDNPPSPAEHTSTAQRQTVTATAVKPAKESTEKKEKGGSGGQGKKILIAAVAAVVVIAALVMVPRLFSSSEPNRSGGEGTIEATDGGDSIVSDGPEENPSAEMDEPTDSDAQVARRTMMVYMIGSTLEYNDGLLGLASMDIEEMQAATHSDDINIIIQTGGAEQWKNPAIKGGTVQRFKLEKDGLNELDDLGQVCMTKESTLSEFIRFASRSYPAEEYILVLWDHGGGVPNGFGQDVYYPNEILSDVEIGKALKMGGVHFDLVAFDACLMCSLEVYMSIKDYADYAVAAESLVVGRGLNYETFINELNDADRSISDCSSVLVDDYIDFLKKNSDTGTMSVVRLDKVQDVYSAYVKYISACYKDLQNNDEKYQEIMKARDDCGDFSGYDFVDLNMLATRYDKGEESTALHNAITNSVVFTQSYGYTNGLGITAYFPYELAWLYDAGRASLVELNYDTSVIGFYDILASRQLYYNNWTQYAGDWYIQPEGSQQSGKSIKLDAVESGGDYVVKLTAEQWKSIYTPSCELWAVDKTYLYHLGFDNIYSRDENGYLKMVLPDSWLQFGSCVPTSQLISVSSDDGGSIFKYFVPAYVNSSPALIQVNYSNESGSKPKVIGYYPCDFTKQDILDIYNLDLASLDYDEGRYFEGNEKVSLVVLAVEIDSEELTILYYDTIAASALNPSFAALNTSRYSDVLVKYTFNDVYGNSYYTDYVTVNF